MADCYQPLEFLREEIGRFSQILPRQVIPISPLFGMLPKGSFPIGMGRNMQMIRYLPSRPVKVTSDYANIFPGGAYDLCSTTGACTPNVTNMGAESELLTWNPKWKAWKSPQFCHNNLVTDYDVANQLENVFSVITDNVRQDIEMEYYLDLVSIAKWGVSLTGTEGGQITPNIERFVNDLSEPTCPLTLGTLEFLSQHGWRRGANGSSTAKSLFGIRNGRPNSLLICGTETAANIVAADVRARSVDGYRASFDPQSLFQPAGSDFLSKYGIRSYNGFNFLENPFPRRGTWNNMTGFVPVADQVDTTTGEDCPPDSASTVNPDWESFETAPIEEAILLLRPDIFEIQSFPVVRSPGGMVQFRNTTSFLGEWELVDWRDCQENPYGLFSYAQAIHAYAPKPLANYAAYKIYFTRCPMTGNCGPCS